MGLIRALLKETRPCPPVPLGGCWSSIPHPRQPAFFPQPKHTHLNGEKHSRHPSSFITGEPLTQWHKLQEFCIKKCCLIPISVCPSSCLYTQVQKVVNGMCCYECFNWVSPEKSFLRENMQSWNICLGIFMYRHCYNMNMSLQAAHTILPHSVSIVNLIQSQCVPSKTLSERVSLLKFLSLYIWADLISSKK